MSQQSSSVLARGMSVDGSSVEKEEEGVEGDIEGLLKRAGIFKIKGGWSSVAEDVSGEVGSIGENKFSVPRMRSDCSSGTGAVEDVGRPDRMEPALIG